MSGRSAGPGGMVPQVGLVGSGLYPTFIPLKMLMQHIVVLQQFGGRHASSPCIHGKQHTSTASWQVTACLSRAAGQATPASCPCWTLAGPSTWTAADPWTCITTIYMFHETQAIDVPLFMSSQSGRQGAKPHLCSRRERSGCAPGAH